MSGSHLNTKLRALLGSAWTDTRSANYDTARKIYNGDINRRPSGIARPRSVADVVNTIRLLADAESAFTVRSSGHNVAGRSVADSVPMLDLGELTNVKVDARAGKIVVEGGATWRDVDSATSAHDLVVPGGIVPSTGVGGLTLGGGVGWLLPTLGLSCDNLIGAKVVSTDAETISCSLTESTSLLTALRGGGHGLGVVTEFTFQAHSLGSIMGGWLKFGESDIRTALQHVCNILPGLTRGTMIAPTLLKAGGQSYLEIDIVSCESSDEFAEIVNSLQKLGPFDVDVGPRTYRYVQSMTDNPRRKGMPSYWRSALTANVEAQYLDDVAVRFLSAPTNECMILIEHYHGQYREEPVGGSCFPWRDRSINVVAIANWADSRDQSVYRANREKAREWARSVESIAFGLERGARSDARYINYDGEMSAVDRLAATDGKVAAARDRLDRRGLLRTA